MREGINVVAMELNKLEQVGCRVVPRRNFDPGTLESSKVGARPDGPDKQARCSPNSGLTLSPLSRYIYFTVRVRAAEVSYRVQCEGYLSWGGSDKRENVGYLGYSEHLTE